MDRVVEDKFKEQSVKISQMNDQIETIQNEYKKAQTAYLNLINILRNIDEKMKNEVTRNEKKAEFMKGFKKTLEDLRSKLFKEKELATLVQKIIEENLIYEKKIGLLVSMIWDIRQQLLYMAPERPALDWPSLKKYQHSLDKSLKDMKNLNNNKEIK
jgi:hypothetical protein